MTDIQIPRGDTTLFDVSAKRYNPVTHVYDPITPTKAWFTAKASVRDADADAIIKKNSAANPTKVIISAGSIRIIIDPSDTAAYTGRWLQYDVQILEAGSGTITTLERGAIEIKSDVTNAIV